MDRPGKGFHSQTQTELSAMAEERFGSNYFASSEDGSSSAPNESRPAIKSRLVDLPWGTSRPTSGAMSPDVVFEARRPEMSDGEGRATHGTAEEASAYRDFRRICDELLVEAKRA